MLRATTNMKSKINLFLSKNCMKTDIKELYRNNSCNETHWNQPQNLNVVDQCTVPFIHHVLSHFWLSLTVFTKNIFAVIKSGDCLGNHIIIKRSRGYPNKGTKHVWFYVKFKYSYNFSTLCRNILRKFKSCTVFNLVEQYSIHTSYKQFSKIIDHSVMLDAWYYWWVCVCIEWLRTERMSKKTVYWFESIIRSKKFVKGSLVIFWMHAALVPMWLQGVKRFHCLAILHSKR